MHSWGLHRTLPPGQPSRRVGCSEKLPTAFGPKASGVSGSILKRMLRSAGLPLPVRQWIDEYVGEKLAGKYGHRRRLRIFALKPRPL